MPDFANLEPPIPAELQGKSVDAAVGELASRQHGVVARRQLVALGVGRHAIRHRVERGRLWPLHRGVYAVGHRVVSREGRWLAAVLAAGPGAVLSHRSAAALWGLRPTSRPVVEVTAPAWRPGTANVRVHARAVPPDEATVRDAIPVTTVPRTLVDLAAVLAPPELRRAVEQAEALRLADPLSLDAVVTHHRGRHGLPRLRAIVDQGVAETVTRSELERRFLALIERHGLPRPQVNVAVRVGDHWIEADCVWRSARVIVELDGHAYHSTRAAFERDREHRRLQAAGWRVVRLTWRQLTDAAAVARDLAGLLTPRDGS